MDVIKSFLKKRNIDRSLLLKSLHNRATFLFIFPSTRWEYEKVGSWDWDTKWWPEDTELYCQVVQDLEVSPRILGWSDTGYDCSSTEAACWAARAWFPATGTWANSHYTVSHDFVYKYEIKIILDNAIGLRYRSTSINDGSSYDISRIQSMMFVSNCFWLTFTTIPLIS